MTVLECGGGAEGRKREFIQNTEFPNYSLFSRRCAWYKPCYFISFIYMYPHKYIKALYTSKCTFSYAISLNHAQCTPKLKV